MKPMLDAFDQARSLLSNIDIPMPRIAVIGDQSTGKSSVLQAIAGVQVPIGSDRVTKCPIELQLRTSPEDEAHDSFEVYIHQREDDTKIKGKKFEDLPKAINDLTAQILEEEKVKEDISHTSIHV